MELARLETEFKFGLEGLRFNQIKTALTASDEVSWPEGMVAVSL